MSISGFQKKQIMNVLTRIIPRNESNPKTFLLGGYSNLFGFFSPDEVNRVH